MLEGNNTVDTLIGTSNNNRINTKTLLAYKRWQNIHIIT